MAFELSHRNRLISRKIKVNGIDLDPDDFISMSLNVSLFDDKQYCELVINDNKELFGTLTNESKLEFFFKDRWGNEYIEEEFVITGIEKRPERTGTNPDIYVIEFIDKIQFDMSNTYESLYFEEKTAGEIILEILKAYDNGTTKWNVSETEYKYSQWSAPQNISQMKVLRKLAIDNSMFFYRGLEHFSVKKLEDIIQDKLPDDIRLKFSDNEETHRMAESNHKLYDAFDIIKNSPSNNLYSMDAFDKKITKTTHKQIDMQGEMKINDTSSFKPLTKEGKEAVRGGLSNLKGARQRLAFQREMLKNTSTTTIIDGDLRIEPGKVIDSLITAKGSNDEDLTLTGSYLVMSVSFNFVGDNFFQELVVCRV